MLLTAKNIQKTYHESEVPVTVLAGLGMEINEGELVGILGSSGSGKSTLLHILGGLDKPDAGEVHLNGTEIYGLRDDELSGIRNRDIGFVFQFFHLLGEFSALENVMLPALIGGESRRHAREKAAEALDMVDLTARSTHRPSQLSGGEQQRVAIARACVMGPKIILADEPTGNLDKENGEKVFHYLMELHNRKRTAMIMVTHNAELAGRLGRIYVLENGNLSEKR